MFTDVTAATYDARLRAMAYKAKTVVEETGANNLYLALGSLLWKLDDRELRSPLVLVPIRLITRARQQSYRIEIDESGASTPNFCLLEKLRLVHGLQVPGLAQPAEDAFGIDLDGALQAMRVALAEAGLPFRVEASAEIAVLQFAKYRLWKDLADHWPELIANPLVEHLVRSPFDPFVDPLLPPITGPRRAGGVLSDSGRCLPGRRGRRGDGRTDVRARGSARNREIADDHQPAGPGDRGRSAGAVRRRETGRAGRRDPSAGRHRARPVLPRSARQVQQANGCPRPDTGGAGPPGGRRRQGLAAVGEDLRASRGQLARYASRLHEPNGAGLSFYSARTAVLSIGDGIDALPIPVALLDVSQSGTLTGLRRPLTTLGDVAAPAAPRPDHPWAFVDSPAVDAALVRTAAMEFDAAVAELPVAGPLADVLRAVRDPAIWPRSAR